METNHTPNKPKILVAEDTLSHRELMEMILCDYDCDFAENGVIAVEKMHSGHYSLVFMDIKMPLMDGLQATREIRSFDKATPIVALTAYAYESERDNALNAGCSDHVAKPFKKASIMAILEKYGLR